VWQREEEVVVKVGAQRLSYTANAFTNQPTCMELNSLRLRLAANTIYNTLAGMQL
jgi:hypothetical protein